MTEAFIGEIRAYAFVRPPRDWALCDGRVLPIAGNTGLFTVIGNKFYGGDGVKTFALPNLVGRVAMGLGMPMGMNNNTMGEQFGADAVTLTAHNLPPHSHTLQRINHGSGTKTNKPGNDSFIGQTLVNYDQTTGKADRAVETFVTNANPDTQLEPGMVGAAGGNQPHENRQPYLKLIYCICIAGEYPPR